MILADKIINERKKNGWSQEELAEQLSVSRQSVSKWEGAQAIPDLQKIVKMAEIFGVSTDYLLKDDYEAPEGEIQVMVESNEEPPIRKVNIEEANKFMNIAEKNSSIFSAAVSFCIISPALLIFLAGLSDFPKFGITENQAAGIGLVALFLLIAPAVFIFIKTNNEIEEFEYLKKEIFDTEYGITGMVKEKKEDFKAKYSTFFALGVILCVLSPVPLCVSGIMELPDYYTTSMVSLLLIIVAIGVYFIVKVSTIMASYEVLLQEKDFSKKNKQNKEKIDLVSGIYWTLATALYLGISFITNAWKMTWIIWPITAVCYGALTMILNLFAKEEK